MKIPTRSARRETWASLPGQKGRTALCVGQASRLSPSSMNEFLARESHLQMGCLGENQLNKISDRRDACPTSK
jgi:hypothetical protein